MRSKQNKTLVTHTFFSYTILTLLLFSSFLLLSKAKRKTFPSFIEVTTNFPCEYRYRHRSDLFFHAPTTKYSRSLYTLFSFGHLSFISWGVVHSIDICSCTKIDANHYSFAASSQSTHARPVYPLISTRLDTIPFYCR